MTLHEYQGDVDGLIRYQELRVVYLPQIFVGLVAKDHRILVDAARRNILREGQIFHLLDCDLGLNKFIIAERIFLAFLFVILNSRRIEGELRSGHKSILLNAHKFQWRLLGCICLRVTDL